MSPGTVYKFGHAIFSSPMSCHYTRLPQVHSILEGMAVGSERRWEKVFILTGALSLHKTLLALALGNNGLGLSLFSMNLFLDAAVC